MVAGPHKKSKICLSTWGPRGTAGLVEEWESRRPIREAQFRRHGKDPADTVQELSAETEDRQP
jgi:hypothetical protein